MKEVIIMALAAMDTATAPAASRQSTQAEALPPCDHQRLQRSLQLGSNSSEPPVSVRL